MRTLCSGFFTALFIAAVASPAMASIQDANSTLGFESTTEWTIQNGTIVGSSLSRTQGAAALVVVPAGYTVLKSRLLGPLGQVSPTLSFDLKLPGTPKPAWAGASQLFVSIPSKGVNNAYIGQVDLGILNRGQFNKVSFTVPDDLLVKLRSTYSDLTFAIVLNVPQNHTDQYLLDNFQASATIPPNTTVGQQDRRTILGFEAPGSWTIEPGGVGGLSYRSSEGNCSLSLVPNGYRVVTSRPLPSIGPVASSFSIDVWPPSIVEAFGAVQLYVSIPSLGVNSAYIGQANVQSLPRKTFSKVSFPVPAWLLPKLNASYTDLQFSIAMNAPLGGTQPYYFDNFQTGSATAPIDLLPANTTPHLDLVGTTNSGLLTVGLDGVNVPVTLTHGEFRIQELDASCIPTGTTACRYVVSKIVLETGGLTVLGTSYGKASIVNLNPFEIVLGGSGATSLSSSIPSNVPFSLNVTGPDSTTTIYPGSFSKISLSPEGAGIITVSAQFQGSIDSHAASLNLVATASTPLANRPPIASAGADRTIAAPSDCNILVTLDGSGITDPDKNIRLIRWYEGNTLLGVGRTPTVKISWPGKHTISVLVEDQYFSIAQDQLILTANIKTCTTSDPPASPVLR